MKKTAMTTALMALILIGTSMAQPARRNNGRTALGGGSSVSIKNRQHRRIGNPIGLGGSVTARVKNQGADGLTNTTSYDFRNTKSRARAAQYNPKEIGIDKARNIAPRKNTGFQEISGIGIGLKIRQARRNQH